LVSDGDPGIAVHPIPGLDPFRTVEAAWMARRRVPAVALLADAAAARLSPV
jgi:hypothetical protein